MHEIITYFCAAMVPISAVLAGLYFYHGKPDAGASLVICTVVFGINAVYLAQI